MIAFKRLWEAAVRRLLGHQKNELELRMLARGFETNRRTSLRVQHLLEKLVDSDLSIISWKGHIDLLNAMSLAKLLSKGHMVKEDWVPLSEAKIRREYQKEWSMFYWRGLPAERRCEIVIARKEWDDDPPEGETV